MAGPTKEFWEQRFAEGNTPWDRGEVNPQCGAWLAAGALKPCRILVPGCGSGYEVAALAQAGFDVTGLDYAPVAIARTRQLLEAANLKAELVEADALTWRPHAPTTRSTSRPACARSTRTTGATTPTSCTTGSTPAEACTRSSCKCCAPAPPRRNPGPALPLRHQRHARAVPRAALGLAKAALSAHLARVAGWRSSPSSCNTQAEFNPPGGPDRAGPRRAKAPGRPSYPRVAEWSAGCRLRAASQDRPARRQATAPGRPSYPRVARWSAQGCLRAAFTGSGMTDPSGA